MSILFSRSARGTGIGLLILRVVIGAIFVAHGSQKLFSFGLEGVTQGFAGMGVPVPGVTAPVVAVVEFVGGILLILGLLTRLAAALLILDMLGAILIVHGKNGLFLPTGYEFVLTLLTANLLLVLAGPGSAAVDDTIGKRGR